MAFCINCGNQIQDGQKFCPVCGAPQKAPAQPKQPKPAKQPKQATGKKSKVGLIIGLAAGGTVLLAGIIIAAAVIISKLGSSDVAEEGGALTALLDETAAQYYGGSVDGASEDSGRATLNMATAPDEEDYTGDDTDTDTDGDTGEDNGAADASGRTTAGPSEAETKTLASQYNGGTQRIETHSYYAEIPDEWYGNNGTSSKGYDCITYSPMGGDVGGVFTLAYSFDREYTQEDLIEDYNLDMNYEEGCVDIDPIVVDGVALSGTSYLEDGFDGKKLYRVYRGLKDGALIKLTIRGKDDADQIFSDPATWFLVYSIDFR
ncbi:MAG: zinc-ribbon domain-containing protein [Lachnospiraceae bacterium]|nr:zinc-ribbon domain-containing protein [Lachnospiraceae bacterium]